ncbi:MAG: Smr/MutS family protein [Desulfobacterales bacterium]|nr:Smr/MutS family protein [Desulfobacterales bacterium]
MEKSKQLSIEEENLLFRQAMSDVKPIKKGKKIVENRHSSKKYPQKNNKDYEALVQLKELITKGKGFKIDRTPEYIEGTGYNVTPDITIRLHEGFFSVQAHIDLHGMIVEEAEHAFKNFLKDAIASDYRCVLVVHGRGLSSPGKPVLKNKVKEWLTRGPFRKWIIAFTSARACDGGAGATYILLRGHPVSQNIGK